MWPSRSTAHFALQPASAGGRGSGWKPKQQGVGKMKKLKGKLDRPSSSVALVAAAKAKMRARRLGRREARCTTLPGMVMNGFS